MVPSETDTDTPRLRPRAFEPLSLGAITPRGWLRQQLTIQADGLTGHIDEIWEDLSDNAWLGGARDGWERGPYYADGLVPLAYLLDDDRLIEKAQTWIDGFLDAQDEDGWFSPTQVEDPFDMSDPWSRFVVCKVLRQYYEATGDERAIEAIADFAEYLLDDPDDWSIEDWAAMRWMDLAVTLQWLYERTGEERLLAVVDLLIDRGFDWTDHLRRFPVEEKQRENPRMESHVVNNAMGVKAPAVTHRQRGGETNRRAVSDGIENFDRFHGQATGVFTGDEHLSGKNPSQGTELCAVVEYMYSLEYLVSALGDAAFGDRLERIAYNALPATFTPDMWAHQYDQQANQVLCTVAERSWTNGPDANIFGQTPHFGCCHANFHQGWPKFAASLWMRAADGGLAAVAYAPCEVTETLENGETVTIVEETDYPFEDRVSLEIDADSPVSMPLCLRIPEWTTDATVTLPDDTTRTPDAGTYLTIEREWEPGDSIELDLSPELTAERRYHGSVSLLRGPLVFSLSVDSERTLIGGTPPHGDWEYYPTEPWNYGLDLNTDDPESSVDVTAKPVGETPFSPETPPVELTVESKLVPDWHLEDNWAAPIPSSPISSDAERESLTLVPYGSTNLRVTEFPLLD